MRGAIYGSPGKKKGGDRKDRKGGHTRLLFRGTDLRQNFFSWAKYCRDQKKIDSAGKDCVKHGGPSGMSGVS